MILAQAIAVGLLCNLVLFETFGLVAGGLITPGYVAYYMDRPRALALLGATALITALVVRLLVRVTILYGRRRFMVAVLFGFACQWSLETILSGSGLAWSRVDSVGYIIPGLIAHEITRQGLGPTALTLVLASAATRLGLMVLNQSMTFW